MTENELKKRFGCDTWPPRWFDSDESLIHHWKKSRSDHASSYVVLDVILNVMETLSYVPSCVSTIFRDILEQRPFEKDIEYGKTLAKILSLLAGAKISGVREVPGIPGLCWDLSIALLLSHDEYILRVISARTLYRLLWVWPEMEELLNNSEKGRTVIAMMREPFTGRTRQIQAIALSVLLRADGALSMPLPCDGRCGHDRTLVLRIMDEWIGKWYERKCDDLDKALNRMPKSERPIWESFLNYLKILDRNRADFGLRMKTKSVVESRIDVNLLKSRFRVSCWPPGHYESKEMLMNKWRIAVRNGSEGFMICEMQFYIRTTYTVPCCISDIFRDVLERKQRFHVPGYAMAMAVLLRELIPVEGKISGFDEAPGLVVLCWEVSINVLLVVKTACGNMKLKDIVPRILCRQLEMWPELQELLKGDEKGKNAVEMLREMLMDKNRLVRTLAVLVLTRIDGALSVTLPCEGKTGRDRLIILRRMDLWGWAWKRKDFGFHERDLRQMKDDGNDDVGLWEGFLWYLRSLDRSK
jgi:hypothetical protein